MNYCAAETRDPSPSRTSQVRLITKRIMSDFAFLHRMLENYKGLLDPFNCVITTKCHSLHCQKGSANYVSMLPNAMYACHLCFQPNTSHRFNYTNFCEFSENLLESSDIFPTFPMHRVCFQISFYFFIGQNYEGFIFE